MAGVAAGGEIGVGVLAEVAAGGEIDVGALAGVGAVSGFIGLALVTVLVGLPATGVGCGDDFTLATGLAATGTGWQAFSAFSNRCQLSRITSG
ncbi:MAG TPA: hypothetical protein VFZ03_14115, partial [Dongiaceae bacterium]